MIFLKKGLDRKHPLGFREVTISPGVHSAAKQFWISSSYTVLHMITERSAMLTVTVLASRWRFPTFWEPWLFVLRRQCTAPQVIGEDVITGHLVPLEA